MKLNAREAAGFLAKPDPRRPGILIYGADAMRVALKRQDMVLALIGPEGEADMRLTRLEPADLRKDPAALLDGLKAQGFFPGQRAVLIESATDQLAPAVTAALKDWQEGDAMLVLTAGALKPSSKLRKLFETHPAAVVAAIYDNPPSRAEIEAELAKAGLGNISREAMEDLTSLAQGLDPGDLRQLIEKLAVYKLNDPEPLEPAELAALAPATIDAGIDDVVQAVAETRTGDIGPLMQRLTGQGVNPTTLCITTGWHFRALYRAASYPGGAAEGVAKARPPIFGPRRDRMIRQANGWGADKLEGALQMITDTDLALRSAGQTAPQLAVIERMFIRLAMMGRR